MAEPDPVILAERRARRAELAEEALLDKLRAAERRMAELEERALAAERRRDDAEREREDAEDDAAQARRDLRAAEQREFSEQQRRVEAEEELGAELRAAREELAALAEAAAAADRRAIELGRDLQRADEATEAAVRRAEAAEERAAHLETMLAAARLGPARTVPAQPPSDASIAQVGRSKPGASSATGGARQVPDAPRDDLAQGLDQAAERLRRQVPPAGDDEPVQPRRSLLRRRR